MEFKGKGRRCCVVRIQSASVSMRKEPCLSSDQCQLHVLEYWPHGSTKVRLQPTKLLWCQEDWKRDVTRARAFRPTSVVMRLRNAWTYDEKHAVWNVKNVVDTKLTIKLSLCVLIKLISYKFNYKLYHIKKLPIIAFNIEFSFSTIKFELSKLKIQ